VLRRIFGSKRNEVTEEWRKLQNEELKTGGKYSTYVGQDRCIQGFGGET